MDSTPPIGQPMTGNMTWYDDSGLGACGQPIDPATQDLVAVSSHWWTTDNPNEDPICQLSVQVTYNDKSITVPVMDKCPTCEAAHIDLSKSAFAQLAPLDEGNVQGITWMFVSS